MHLFPNREPKVPRAVRLAAVGLLALSLPALASTPWNDGDLFIGAPNGSYVVYAPDGTFKETISDGQGGTATTCAFDTQDNLYTANYESNRVIRFNGEVPHDIVQTIQTANGGLETIGFSDNGDLLAGHNFANIERLDAAGNSLQVTPVPRVDHIDLANDQTTVYFTQGAFGQPPTIFRLDTTSGQLLSNFATVPGNNRVHSLKLLAPGDGSGGLLVANETAVLRLDGSGNVIQTYTTPSAGGFFYQMALDPNGTSFWVNDYVTSNVYRFNINSGALEAGPINPGFGGFISNGLCVKGQLTAARDFRPPPVPLNTKTTALPVISTPLSGGQLRVTVSARLEIVSANPGDPLAPLAGQQISFFTRLSGNLICTATTNSAGVATCTGVISSARALLNLGFTASYAGTAQYNASGDYGSLLRLLGALGF